MTVLGTSPVSHHVVVELDTAGVALFVRHHDTLGSVGVRPALLLCAGARHDAIARSFVTAGRGHQLLRAGPEALRTTDRGSADRAAVGG